MDDLTKERIKVLERMKTAEIEASDTGRYDELRANMTQRKQDVLDGLTP